MKAEKVIGIAACAFACVTSSAFANTTNGWFGVTADTAIRASNCETNGAAVTVKSNRIVLDNDKDTALVITNFTGDTTSDGIVKISATALLTPNSTNDLADAVTVDAKAGFAVGIDDNNATNFYGYANGEWHQLSGQADNYDWDSDTTFSMILNYRDKVVSFYVGDVLLNSADSLQLASTATGLNAIDAYGSGSITSITGAYEVAVAAYDGKKYGSIDEAVTEAGDSAALVVTYDESGTQEPPAGNGMPTWVCKALDIATDNPDATPAVVPSGADKNKSAITLKLNYDPTRDGAAKAAGVLKFKVGDGVLQDSDNIQIPLESGNYRIKVVY